MAPKWKRGTATAPDPVPYPAHFPVYNRDLTWQIFTKQDNYEWLWLRLFALLEPREIEALGATCVCFRDLIDGTLNNFRELKDKSIVKRWTIENSLARFVDDPHRFRYMQYTHDAIVGGSFALQFFASRVWDDVLEVFIQKTRAKRTQSFGEYLDDEEHYTLKAKAKMPGSPNSRGRIDMKAELFRYDKKTHKKMTIIVYQTLTPPWDAIITGSYSTALCNMITWDTAYCLYPDLTLRNKTMHRIEPVDETSTKALIPYTRNGFTIQEITPGSKGTRLNSTNTALPRSIGDSWTWNISLPFDPKTDTEKRKFWPKPNYALEFSTFQICNPTVRTWTNYPAGHQIIRDEFQHCIFRQRYYCAPMAGEDFWMEHRERFDILAMQMLRKLGLEPEGTDLLSWLVRQIRDRPPDGWCFFDEDLAEWFEDWENEKLDDARHETEVAEMVKSTAGGNSTNLFLLKPAAKPVPRPRLTFQGKQ